MRRLLDTALTVGAIASTCTAFIVLVGLFVWMHSLSQADGTRPASPGAAEPPARPAVAAAQPATGSGGTAPAAAPPDASGPANRRQRQVSAPAAPAAPAPAAEGAPREPHSDKAINRGIAQGLSKLGTNPDLAHQMDAGNAPPR